MVEEGRWESTFRDDKRQDREPEIVCGAKELKPRENIHALRTRIKSVVIDLVCLKQMQIGASVFGVFL